MKSKASGSPTYSGSQRSGKPARVLSPLLIGSAAGWLYYRWWQNRAEQRLFARSQVVRTRLGQVEYSVQGGEGPVVVVSHGLPGGFDQGMVLAGWLNAAPCRFIAISRPGYLRTPLQAGETHTQQADLIAALLDALDIPDAAMLGMSGGAPSAVQFAIRYPERCWALILTGAVAKCMDPPGRPDSPFARPVLGAAGFALWIQNRLFHIDPRFARGLLLPEEIEEVRRNGGKAFLDIVDSYVPLRGRVEGVLNDARQIARLPGHAPAGVICPAIIIHGDGDTIVPFEHALTYRQAIPHAELVILPEGGHLAGVARQKEVSARVVDFIVQVLQPATLKR